MGQIDLDNLFTAIVSLVQADESSSEDSVLGTLTGIYFDQVPEGAIRPYLRFSIVGDTHQDVFGLGNLDQIQMQFSVFANTLAQANNIVKEVNGILHGSTLSLTGQTNVGSRVIDGKRVKMVTLKPGVPVYHASTVVEFTVGS